MKRWAIIVILMGFAVALSVARNHLACSLMGLGAGGAAETCFHQLHAGDGGNPEVRGNGEATRVEPLGHTQVCAF
jgi:hypothetical protein